MCSSSRTLNISRNRFSCLHFPFGSTFHQKGRIRLLSILIGLKVKKFIQRRIVHMFIQCTCVSRHDWNADIWNRRIAVTWTKLYRSFAPRPHCSTRWISLVVKLCGIRHWDNRLSSQSELWCGRTPFCTYDLQFQIAKCSRRTLKFALKFTLKGKWEK